jgi:hypothetical protein
MSHQANRPQRPVKRILSKNSTLESEATNVPVSTSVNSTVSSESTSITSGTSSALVNADSSVSSSAQQFQQLDLASNPKSASSISASHSVPNVPIQGDASHPGASATDVQVPGAISLLDDKWSLLVKHPTIAMSRGAVFAVLPVQDAIATSLLTTPSKMAPFIPPMAAHVHMDVFSDSHSSSHILRIRSLSLESCILATFLSHCLVFPLQRLFSGHDLEFLQNVLIGLEAVCSLHQLPSGRCLDPLIPLTIVLYSPRNPFMDEPAVKLEPPIPLEKQAMAAQVHLAQGLETSSVSPGFCRLQVRFASTSEDLQRIANEVRASLGGFNAVLSQPTEHQWITGLIRMHEAVRASEGLLKELFDAGRMIHLLRS